MRFAVAEGERLEAKPRQATQYHVCERAVTANCGDHSWHKGRQRTCASNGIIWRTGVATDPFPTDNREPTLGLKSRQQVT